MFSASLNSLLVIICAIVWAEERGRHQAAVNSLTNPTETLMNNVVPAQHTDELAVTSNRLKTFTDYKCFWVLTAKLCLVESFAILSKMKDPECVLGLPRDNLLTPSSYLQNGDLSGRRSTNYYWSTPY